MSTRTSTDAAVERLAADQRGTWSDHQGRQLGVHPSLRRRRVAAGRWLRPHEGVCLLPGHPPSFERSLWIGVHLCHPDAMVGPRSAGALYGLTGLARNRLEVLVPHGTRNHNPVARVIQTRHMPRRTWVDGMPVPPIERVVCDLARFVGATHLGAIADQVVRDLRTTTYARLQREFLERASPAWPGLGRMAAVLAERIDEVVPTRSDLERVLRRIVASIPGVDASYEVQIGDRRDLRHIVDCVLPEAKLIIEADGRTFHERLDQMAQDRRRDRRAAVLGYHTFRFTYAEIMGDPDRVRREIATYLGRVVVIGG